MGPNIRIYLNDVLTTDYVDTVDREGYLAVQHHGEKGQIYRFRNLRIRELSAPKVLAEKMNGLPLAFFEDFESGAGRWTQTDPNAWKVTAQDQNHVYSLYQQSKYEPPVRSPFNIARISDVNVSDFVVQARMEQTGKEYGHRDMCVIFGYQDPSHFYYVHIATKADAVAHSILIVNGEPRVSIVKERTEGTDWSTGFHDVRVVRDTASGLILVFFDDMDKPIMTRRGQDVPLRRHRLRLVRRHRQHRRCDRVGETKMMGPMGRMGRIGPRWYCARVLVWAPALGGGGSASSDRSF